MGGDFCGEEMYKTFDDVLEKSIEKFNPYHDKAGRFCSSDGASFMTYRTKDPKKQHLADLAISRAKNPSASNANGTDGLDSIKNGDWESLRKYSQKTIGATITDIVAKRVDFETIRDTVKGIEWVQNEFSMCKGQLNEIDGRVDPSALLDSSSNGKIRISLFKTDSKEKMLKEIEDMANDGIIPKGSNIVSIGVHEAVHQLEYIARDKKYPQKNEDGTDNFMNALRVKQTPRTISESVVNASLKSAKKQKGYGKTRNAELVRDISSYASKNSSETIAEAVSDCYLHGDDASVLSKEIFKTLKERFN